MLRNHRLFGGNELGLKCLNELTINNIKTKPMTNEYYKSLPDDKLYAYYNPNQFKYFEVYINGKRIGYVGYGYEENKYWAIVYIEKKYRNQNLIKTMYNIIVDKLDNEPLYAKIEKDNKAAVKATKKFYSLVGSYDKDHYIFKIN